MREIADLTYYQKNRNVILNKAKDYYQNNKERLKEQARDKSRSLSEEEKNKILKREYGKNRYVWGKETETKRIPKKLLYKTKKLKEALKNKSFFCSLHSIKND